MKITFDKEIDTAYIYLKEEIKPGEAIKNMQVEDNIILDFDINGKLLGIEILNVSTKMPQDFLSNLNINNLVTN